MSTVSEIIAVTKGKVLAKTGAEGIYTGKISEDFDNDHLYTSRAVRP